MNNKNSIWCNIIGVICFFMGVALISTLILIPLAIYCFIGGSRYFTWANMSDTELASQKKSLKNWAIFVSIVGFPIGLISIIPAINAGNKVTVTDVNEEKTVNKDESSETVNKANIKGEAKEEPKAEHENTTSNEETIAKLKKFKEDGLITEAEYKRAISELKEER